MTTYRVTPADDIEGAIAALLPGDMLLFEDGVYKGITIPSNISGTSSQPITIAASNKWGAVLFGNANRLNKHGISCAGSSIILNGFQIFGAIGDGIKIQRTKAENNELKGINNKILNCWIHHNSGNGIGGHFGDDDIMNLEIANCLVEFNGSIPFQTHGIYAIGDNLVIRNSIIRNNVGWGLHLFGGLLRNCNIFNNLICSNGQHVNCDAIFVQIPMGGGDNRIINNTIVSRQHSALNFWLIDSPKQYDNGLICVNNILINEIRNPTIIIPDNSFLITKNRCWPPHPKYGELSGDWRTYFVSSPELGVFWLREFLEGTTTANPLITEGTASYYDSLSKKDFWGDVRSGSAGVGAFPYKSELESGVGFRGTWLGNTHPYAYSETYTKLKIPDFWNKTLGTIKPTAMEIESGQK